jgi:hypothetical protein
MLTSPRHPRQELGLSSTSGASTERGGNQYERSSRARKLGHSERGYSEVSTTAGPAVLSIRSPFPADPPAVGPARITRPGRAATRAGIGVASSLPRRLSSASRLRITTSPAWAGHQHPRSLASPRVGQGRRLKAHGARWSHRLVANQPAPLSPSPERRDTRPAEVGPSATSESIGGRLFEHFAANRLRHTAGPRKTDLTLRQEARERRIDTIVRPFAGTLRVTNPVRKSRASSRKRVWRGGG